MKKQLHISIPKPCHEDWRKMTPYQQGKFCNSCAKTVVDFTKKSVTEIQSFFIVNQGKKVCGRFQQTQLDTITIEIPEQVLFQQHSFSKIFLLSLLITMGATLMSCNNDGKKQKINQVIVLDSIANSEISIHEKIDSLGANTKVDSIRENKKDTLIEKLSNPPIPPPPITTVGMTVLGLPQPEPQEEKDSIKEIEEPMPFGMIEASPKFKNSITKGYDEQKEEFRKKMTEFINSNLDLNIIKEVVPPGKYKNYTRFTIDSLGKVTDIQTRAKYSIIESEINKIIAELPDFIPATQRHKPVPVKYTVPIHFIIE
ncbi:hypothetical protein FF125_01000 [Aureibaculum algae]|uniref:TonB C-terminal domain-containing protein n=1 Tax=Aureibaculum algae TaxID=2584122 RepID=A0A5B7TRA0_9FLAO|nr:hypothetical protein [Aureibaculum algae]QCX37082.1 hypothetical protein FF125_01000 [Aureibaculum algae]